jgi:hypothetical protein
MLKEKDKKKQKKVLNQFELAWQTCELGCEVEPSS